MSEKITKLLTTIKNEFYSFDNEPVVANDMRLDIIHKYINLFSDSIIYNDILLKKINKIYNFNITDEIFISIFKNRLWGFFTPFKSEDQNIRINDIINKKHKIYLINSPNIHKNDLSLTTENNFYLIKIYSPPHEDSYMIIACEGFDDTLLKIIFGNKTILIYEHDI